MVATGPGRLSVRRALAWLLYYGGLLAFALLFIRWQLIGRVYGDEWRYTFYAQNLLDGHYSPPGVVFIWNGPGYPLFLAPFRALELSWSIARYANAFLLVGAVAYFRHTLRPLAGARWAAIAGLLLGVFPPLLWHLRLLYSETLAAFLVTAFAYHYLQALRRDDRRHLVAAGLLLGALALTKIVFGTALLVWGGLAVAGFAITRARALRRTAVVAAIALGLCAPYLAYTHHLTGRPLYWGSAMGMSLYFMSSPHPGESGDWYHQGHARKVRELRQNHLAVLERIGRFDEVPKDSPIGELHYLCTDEADEEFRRLAMQNIRAHPGKYFENWLANVSRLFFDTPFSYPVWPHQPRVFAVNAVVLLLLAWSVIAALRDRRRVDAGALMLLVLGVIALGGISLISAVGRYSAPVMPLLGLWIVAVLAGRARAADERAAAPDADGSKA
jgi:4-amino-4-deoxy-L-arabinose transferase-like glycosyltransferase